MGGAGDTAARFRWGLWALCALLRLPRCARRSGRAGQGLVGVGGFEPPASWPQNHKIAMSADSSVGITLDTYSHAIPAMDAEAAVRVMEIVKTA